MNEVAMRAHPVANAIPERAVAFAVRSWFVVTATGHWIFLAYILAVFFVPIVGDGTEGLRASHLPGGFREGDAFGNLAASGHVLLAAIVIGGGPLQLIPAIRSRLPVFHRWLGRSYLLAAVLSGISGLYMLWTRGTVGDFVSHVAISIDGVLIIVFAALALRFAIARQLGKHRRWALRLFMAASAVWFFRVGLMGWAMLTGGVGMDFESFTGPMLTVLGFAQYLLPLAMLQWYFRCQVSAGSAERLSFALTLAGLTLFMATGIVAATMGMWLPRM